MAKKPQKPNESCRKSSGDGMAIQSINYDALHGEGTKLIDQWLSRALDKENGGEGRAFERFIYAWIAFNGLASCLTGKEKDSEILAAIAGCPSLQLAFDRQKADSLAFSRQVAALCGEFPIFRVSDIRGKELKMSHDRQERSEMRNLYRQEGVECEPRCWFTHADGCPQDWAHVLFGIYRVRNNLFHGEKSVTSDQDAFIVDAAYQVLVNFQALWALGPRRA